MSAYRPIQLPSNTPFGCKEYVTEIGVHVLDINYRADPAKRSDDWIRSARQGKDKRTWQREFEGDWSSVAGQPVFPPYDSARHVAQGRLAPQPGSIIVVGIDPGLSPGAAFTQKNVWGQLQVFRTLQPQQVSVLQFGAELLANLYTEAQLRTLFSPEFLASWPVPMKFDDVWSRALLDSVTPLCGLAGEVLAVKYVGDPAGMQRSATAGKDTYFGQLKKLFRIVVHPSKNSWPTRVGSLTSLLLDGANTPDGEPLFIISGGEEGKKDTEFLRDAFAGAYAYPDNMTIEQPPKGPHSHPMDALQYAVMEHYPQGAGKVYGASLSTSYAALVGASSGEEAARTALPTVPASPEDSTTTPPLVYIGENGLTTFSKPWNPFLDSFG